MENLKISTEKLCSFYVSEWHLVTMVLPYINKELNEKANITAVLEKSIEENIRTLIAKLNLKNENKILQINWNKSKGLKYSELDRKFKSISIKENNTNIIFVNGSKTYIDSVNQNIEKWINRNANKVENVKFKIVNCYEVTEFNSSIRDILNTHDKILNTAGEKEISDVFDGYYKKAANNS